MDKNQALIYQVGGKDLKLNRPEPISEQIEVFRYRKIMPPSLAVEALIEGEYVLVADFYSSGLSILNELNYYLKSNYKNQSFKEQRDYRSLYRELSHKLLVSVQNNKLLVRKAPEIGWLKELYPDVQNFLLPFPQVQGLNSSWQWREKGIQVPVLKDKIHPFFGTYFPTRFEHILLFENWLKNYQGNKTSAIEIGVGSGILSFQLLKHGFKKVYATDSNENAIIGLSKHLSNIDSTDKIALSHGDLFAACPSLADIIVFNPPWIPSAGIQEGLDQAIYYEESLFPRFFEAALGFLKEEGKLVLIFSNFAEISEQSSFHPIKHELETGKRFKLDSFLQKKVANSSKHTKRKQVWRKDERVELWVLKLQ